jgi:hypothetical protein
MYFHVLKGERHCQALGTSIHLCEDPTHGPMGHIGKQFVLTESRGSPKESTSSCQIKQRWTMWSPAETRYYDIPWHTMTHIYIYMTYYDYVGLFQNHLWCHPLLVPSCAHPTPKAHGDHVVCDLFHLQSMEENQKPLEILEMTGKLGYKTKANWDLWCICRTKLSYTVSSPTYNWGVTFRHLITTI